jgi:hypothetical protein
MVELERAADNGTCLQLTFALHDDDDADRRPLRPPLRECSRLGLDNMLCRHHETTVHLLHEDTLCLPTIIDRMLVHHVFTLSRLVVDLLVLLFRAQRGAAF